jgi:hypothetical protein
MSRRCVARSALSALRRCRDGNPAWRRFSSLLAPVLTVSPPRPRLRHAQHGLTLDWRPWPAHRLSARAALSADHTVLGPTPTISRHGRCEDGRRPRRIVLAISPCTASVAFKGQYFAVLQVTRRFERPRAPGRTQRPTDFERAYARAPTRCAWHAVAVARRCSNGRGVLASAVRAW